MNTLNLHTVGRLGLLAMLGAVAACTTMGTAVGNQRGGDTRVETLAPLWVGWGGPWRGRFWGPYPDTAFVTHYSGRVVANLADVAGDPMRCHFTLMHPQHGMAGGGEGECQLPSGQTIDATFANS